MNLKMKWYKIDTIALVLLFAILLPACKQKAEKGSRVDTLPYYNDASFTPKWEINDSDFHKIPDFKLTNQEGNTITQKDVAEKIFVADFFFTTCPGICPKMTRNMGTIQKEFINDDEVFLLSHSVTPETDSVPMLKAYAKRKGIKTKTWFLLTGDRDQIYKLGRKAYFVEEDLGVTKSNDDFLHTENFVLIDKNRHIRGIYNGLNKTAIQQLIADIKTLKKEG